MDEYGKVQRGENFSKINSFPRSKRHFISLMSETWEPELFISINFQRHEIYKGHHLHHNVGYDIMHCPEGSDILLLIRTIYYLKVVLPLSSLETILIIQKAPRRSLCCSIEEISLFSTKDDIKS